MTQDLRKTRARKRRGKAFWRRTFLAQQNSGLSQLEFCRRNDLPISTFYSWRRRLRGEADDPEATAEFVEVHHAPSSEPMDENGFELVFPNGLRLKLPSRVQGRDLAEVLWALQVADPC